MKITSGKTDIDYKFACIYDGDVNKIANLVENLQKGVFTDSGEIVAEEGVFTWTKDGITSNKEEFTSFINQFSTIASSDIKSLFPNFKHENIIKNCDFGIDAVRFKDNKVECCKKVDDKEYWMGLENHGSGVNKIFKILAAMESKYPVLEEWDTSIHPVLAAHLIPFLKSSKKELLLGGHNPGLIDEFEPKDVYFGSEHLIPLSAFGDTDGLCGPAYMEGKYGF